VEVCPAEARKLVGEIKTSEQVTAEAEKDMCFYRRSGGGITLSGGEPLMQPLFASEILWLCKQRNIHTAIETSGFARWADFMKILQYTDFIYYDIKHMDSSKHKMGTGVGNELILENIMKIPKSVNLVVRIPIVPGFNDSEENIKETTVFVKELGKVNKIELLPYHQLGVSKCEYLGKTGHSYNNIDPPNDQKVTFFKHVVELNGLQCEVV
jgi:pyruvate formate lyase activating enzyme